MGRDKLTAYPPLMIFCRLSTMHFRLFVTMYNIFSCMLFSLFAGGCQ